MYVFRLIMHVFIWISLFDNVKKTNNTDTNNKLLILFYDFFGFG